MLRLYKVLEEFLDAGKIISLGVSNFNITQLKFILENSRIKPVVNQFESHPGNWNYELSEYCLANNVYPMAHSSIKLTSEEAKDKLHVIGDKYKKKWSQVILNYQLSLKMSVIPKSTSKKHQLRNMQILDFVLSPEDKAIIRNL
jgi:diketogulonate reductase-like aldo/keto reductase